MKETEMKLKRRSTFTELTVLFVHIFEQTSLFMNVILSQDGYEEYNDELLFQSGRVTYGLLTVPYWKDREFLKGFSCK